MLGLFSFPTACLEMTPVQAGIPTRVPIYFVTHHADHLPLALGMLRAQVFAHRDGALLAHFEPLPIVSRDAAGMQALWKRHGRGIWLFSDYLWSQDYNLGLAAAVKAADPGNLTIHGGPSAPKYAQACEQHMARHPQVDVVVRGEGEQTLVELLEALATGGGLEALAGVPGLTYRAQGRVVRTAERERIADVDALPSPYLGGHFDHYGGEVVAAIVETNRGCPYACTFCDWGSATQQKIRRFELERVKSEIEWIGKRGIQVLWIADANFGIFQRDVEIAGFVAETKARYGAPREVVVNYPKNATGKIAEIVKIFARAGICGQGVVSIQTTDPETLRVIRRDNIRTDKYDELARIFREEGLPLSTDLMIGLPGATVASFKADLQRYFDEDIWVKAYRTQLLPNSPMADPEYRREHRIRVDANQFLVATASYDERDLGEMIALWQGFNILDGYGVLRYVSRHLQWDHGVPGTELVHRLVQSLRTAPGRYPAITAMFANFNAGRPAATRWEQFQEEVGRFITDAFGIGMQPALATVLRANALAMPSPGRAMPETHPLAHDLVAYFRDHLDGRGGRPLAEYPPGEFRLEDPFGLCRTGASGVEQYDSHQVFFELSSPVSRRRSVPNFVAAGGKEAVAG